MLGFKAPIRRFDQRLMSKANPLRQEREFGAPFPPSPSIRARLGPFLNQRLRIRFLSSPSVLSANSKPLPGH